MHSSVLVDDNNFNQKVAKGLLEKRGHTIEVADDGLVALDRLHAENFDLVLMDIHMPDMDGVEAARGIRALYADDARPGAGRPPIVALTANAFEEDRAGYLAAGLDDYLAKPFEKRDLAGLLTRWLGEDGRGRQETGAGAA